MLPNEFALTKVPARIPLPYKDLPQKTIWLMIHRPTTICQFKNCGHFADREDTEQSTLKKIGAEMKIKFIEQAHKHKIFNKNSVIN